MSQNLRLELTWVGKDQQIRLEPRVLIEDVANSYHASARSSENEVFDNSVILGDNLLALAALASSHTGTIGCIYIDPPYNTGAAFAEYDDGIEHSLWLTHMRDRLVHLWTLLRSDRGVLLISINDDECHYLKVLCDELFGRIAFKGTLIWNTEGNTDNQAKIIRYHEYVLVYCKGELPDLGVIDPNISENSKLKKESIRNTIVKNGPKNPISSISLPEGFPADFQSGTVPARNGKWPQIDSDIRVSDFSVQSPTVVRSGWSSKDLLLEFISRGFEPVLDTKGQLTKFMLTRTGAIEAEKVRKQDKGHFVSVLRGFGTTNQMRIMLEKLHIRFSFPKPIGLIEYLLEAFSNPDDTVLDSYAGSGTTGQAVLGLNKRTGSKRRFILVEQFKTTVEDVLLPRLRAVIDGNAEAEMAAHGGGFRFYRLAPSLIETDRWGNRIISKKYNAAMLAEAVCKHLGFTYAPSTDLREYWKHGYSSERDFIYVTTASLTAAALRGISEDIGQDRTLLICCKAFDAKADAFDNLTIKKIPQAVLATC